MGAGAIDQFNSGIVAAESPINSCILACVASIHRWTLGVTVVVVVMRTLQRSISAKVGVADGIKKARSFKYGSNCSNTALVVVDSSRTLDAALIHAVKDDNAMADTGEVRLVECPPKMAVFKSTA